MPLRPRAPGTPAQYVPRRPSEGWLEGEVYVDLGTGEEYYTELADQPAASSNAGAGAGAPRDPDLTRTYGRALKGISQPCWIERALTDESIAKMAGSFATVNAMLDEVWLRETIQTINAQLGNVSPSDVKRALRSSFALCARRMPIPFGEKGHVKFPREFAAHLIKSELGRQKGGR